MSERLYLKAKWMDIELSDGSIIHVETVNMEESVVMLAAESWIARTNKYTSESLCDYINLKRRRGLTDHYAAPTKELLQKLVEAEYE